MKKNIKMELSDINDVVVEQICELFDVLPGNNLTTSNIKDWDSINHINLMVMIEDVFKINLDYTEFKNCDNNTKISKLVLVTINE